MPFHYRVLITSLLFCFCAAPEAAQQKHSEPSEIHLQIERILDTPRAEIQGEKIVTQSLLREIYAAGGYEPLWVHEKKVHEMTALLGASVDYGLRPQDYHLSLIERLDAVRDLASSPVAFAQRDILLTEGLMLYSYHRRYGKVNAGDLYPEVRFTRQPYTEGPPAAFIHRALAFDSLADFVDSIAPTAEYYELLRKQLKRYRKIALQGGWPRVSQGPTLREKDRGARVAEVRRRLQVTGEAPDTAAAAADVFDGVLEHAVKAFQALHGLDTDGVVGGQTLAAMNISAATRVDQLRLSLERLRWIAKDVGDEFIAVNIAGFRLSFVRDLKIIWTTRVVVGTPYRKTPIFRSELTYLDFNPTWTVPPTILREDKLPEIKKDPGYLAANNISVIDSAGHRVDPATIDWKSYRNNIPYTLVQEPGPNNALGLVKFIFPNPYFIYMHDTPQRELFKQPQRTFSSGCIRVENPFELVKLVLQDQKNSGQIDVKGILDSGRTQRVVLDKPIPVWILYLTAALDPSGQARFYPDIYQRDAAVLRLLDGPVTADPP